MIMDDPVTDLQFKEILIQVRRSVNKTLSDQMTAMGIVYKVNLGVPLVTLRETAASFQSSHLLALKLWNKQWRETKILASLLDQPQEVSEQQMDFWTKSFDNCEIAEQVSANLWCRTSLAYVKALEWCRGKKHWIRYTGIHLAGKLAVSDSSSPDEMFEPFFDEFATLSRDPLLSTVIYRTIVNFGNRSDYLDDKISEWVDFLGKDNSEHAANLANQLALRW